MLKTSLVLLSATTVLLGQSTSVPYTWAKTGPLQVARQAPCVAPLQDGHILVAGGQDNNGALRSVEIYQPDGSFAPARDMLRARFGHTCTTLLDGRVLVAGGLGDGPAVHAEVYDPVADVWTAVENGTERWNHSATLLPDGRVLLAAGETIDGSSSLLEWFNPVTNRIRALSNSLSAARTLHASALLPDGSVLVSGGWNTQALLDANEIVKLDGSVRIAATLPEVRAGHTATTLDNGCVLIAGGIGADGDLKSASRYCPDSDAFQAVGDMSVPRFAHLALRLPNNGKVLVTGGFSQGEATAVSELFDPDTNSFLPAGPLTLARLGVAAAVDPISGAVLAVGGYTAEGPVAACGILKGPSVIFDKARYLDGDFVTVTGLSWTPGETVRLTVLTTLPSKQVTSATFSTIASALGRIQQPLFTASVSTIGATFQVTATGLKSGLTVSASALEIARTTMTLNVTPFPALTRQPVTIQAIVQPVTALGALDGMVNFQLGAATLGSVSTTNQITSISSTGQITDGSSNTILIGETLASTSSGFSSRFFAPDGSVHFLNPGGAFQLVTRDIPAGSNVLTANTPGSVTTAYAPITSPYAPVSATSTVSVQKRTVDVAINAPLLGIPGVSVPKVGDLINLAAAVRPNQSPLADVLPSGVVHITVAPGTVIDVSLSSSGGFAPSAQAPFSVALPAGTHTFSAQYNGDDVYLAGSVSGAGSVTVVKGNVGLALIPGKSTYSFGEPITLLARLLHPRVAGATPTGQITRAIGPAQFQGATIGTDPGNSGIIDTNLPVNGFPPPGNFTVTMTYGGDANFSPVSAGTILTIAKAVPQITLIQPSQIVAGQQATFVVRASSGANISAGPITGQVTLAGDITSSSASFVASANSSTATIRQTFPNPGTYSIFVQYSGDASYQAVNTVPVQVVVSAAAPSSVRPKNPVRF